MAFLLLFCSRQWVQLSALWLMVSISINYLPRLLYAKYFDMQLVLLLKNTHINLLFESLSWVLLSVFYLCSSGSSNSFYTIKWLITASVSHIQIHPWGFNCGRNLFLDSCWCLKKTTAETVPSAVGRESHLCLFSAWQLQFHPHWSFAENWTALLGLSSRCWHQTYVNNTTSTREYQGLYHTSFPQ